MKLPVYILLTLSIHTIMGTDQPCKKHIGLLVMGTGIYKNFLPMLINSARKYFCPGHQITYFVFTDGQLPATNDTVILAHKKIGWPYDVLMRPAVYEHYADYFNDIDYIFSCDADMLFVDYIGDEILGERVATLHPAFVGTRGTYETHPESSACIHFHEGTHYFMSAFYGGTREEFLRMTRVMNQHIQEDMQRNIIALWHDESHFNRYLVDNPPTIILSPAYSYPGETKKPVQYGIEHIAPKLMILEKNTAVFHT